MLGDARRCSEMPWDAAGMLGRDSDMRFLVILILKMPRKMS